MSTLELEHLKHTSSSSNNLSVHSDGSLTLGMLQGNIGIGTASPTVKLEAVGDIKASVSGANAQISAITDGSSNYATFTTTNGSRSYSMQVRPDQSNSFAIRDETGGGNRLLIATTGSVTHPSNACYESSTGSFSSQGSASLNNMDFGSGLTARFNQGSKITYTHTNGGRFTVANAGMYEITLQTFVDLQSGDVRAYFAQMNRNGSGYTTWGHWSMKLVVNTTHGMAHMTTLANLSANDYLEFKYRLYDSPTATLRPRVIIKQVG